MEREGSQGICIHYKKVTSQAIFVRTAFTPKTQCRFTKFTVADFPFLIGTRRTALILQTRFLIKMSTFGAKLYLLTICVFGNCHLQYMLIIFIFKPFSISFPNILVLTKTALQKYLSARSAITFQIQPQPGFTFLLKGKTAEYTAWLTISQLRITNIFWKEWCTNKISRVVLHLHLSRCHLSMTGIQSTVPKLFISGLLKIHNFKFFLGRVALDMLIQLKQCGATYKIDYQQSTTRTLLICVLIFITNLMI